MMESGVNPYESSHLGAGTSSHLDQKLTLDTTKHDQVRFEQLDRKWGKLPPPGPGTNVFRVGDYPNSPLESLGLTVPDAKPINPDKLTCSFCKKEVDRIHATEGKGKLDKFYKREIVDRGSEGIEIIEKIVHFTPTVVACPNCCLNVKQGINFPSDE